MVTLISKEYAEQHWGLKFEKYEEDGLGEAFWAERIINNKRCCFRVLSPAPTKQFNVEILFDVLDSSVTDQTTAAVKKELQLKDSQIEWLREGY